MTQLFSKSSTPPVDKRAFSNPHHKQSGGHFPQRVKNFFRMNSSGSFKPSDGADSPQGSGKGDTTIKSIRQSRFLGGIGRNRSVTVNSEGNPLDDGLSPTARANPYFAHQGPPALRHHNESSVPASPTDSPKSSKFNLIKNNKDKTTTAGKEELARRLRRVASAPNAQGLFAKDKDNGRPQTAEMGKEPVLLQQDGKASITLQESPKSTLPLPTADGAIPSPGEIRETAAFRRTYSSNSIKVREVEVGPSSFDKIKLIGKGDVGKVYLVREKKSGRLYAMKGESAAFPKIGH
jgi:protein-serine/threonine kinase